MCGPAGHLPGAACAEVGVAQHLASFNHCTRLAVTLALIAAPVCAWVHAPLHRSQSIITVQICVWLRAVLDTGAMFGPHPAGYLPGAACAEVGVAQHLAETARDGAPALLRGLLRLAGHILHWVWNCVCVCGGGGGGSRVFA